MKKLFSTLLLATVLMAGQTLAAGEIVFVDLQELFTRFYKTQLAQTQIQEQTADIEYERDNMKEDITAMQDQVEELRADARNETLSEDLRQSKRDQLEEKLVELQKLDQEVLEYEKLRKEQLEQQKARMSRKIFDEIHEVVNAYAKEQGFAAVIDRSAQSRAGTQAILFVDKQSDITAELLEVLNAGHEIVEEAESEVVKEL